jgi:hypothetical protein
MSFIRRSLRAAVLTVLVTVLSGAPLAALGECEFLQETGELRGCTFTEEHGQCLVWALESYYDCMEDAKTFLGRTVCKVAVQVDLFACNVELAGDMLRRLSPFTAD